MKVTADVVFVRERVNINHSSICCDGLHAKKQLINIHIVIYFPLFLEDLSLRLLIFKVVKRS